MSCNLTIMKSSVTELLRQKVGTNDTLFSSYISEVISNEDFTPEFKNWCKKHIGHEVDYNTTTEAEVAVNAIRTYYNEQKPDINFSSRIQNDSTLAGNFGYSSVDAWSFARRIGSNFSLDVYHQTLHEKHTTIEELLKVMKEKTSKTITKKEFIASAVTAKVKNIIIERLEAKGINKIDIINAFKTNNTAQLESWFGDNTSIQDKNVMAMYKEILGNRETFFKEVFRDSRLGDIRFDKDDTLESDDIFNITEAQDAIQNNGEDNSNNNTSKDKTIDNLNNKDGQYDDFMTHVGMSVRSYLNSLKKLNSGNTQQGYDYNTDNDFGIPDCVNENECCAAIYSHGNFTNVATMIRSIRDIANDVPGFAALYQMADYLEENKDFAFEVYRTFGKIIISKMETVMNGNIGRSSISNRSADKLTSLRFEYINSVKSTSILIDDLNSKSLYKGLKEKIDAVDTFLNSSNKNLKLKGDIKKSELISELSSQLRRYYPTIQDTSIANYIENANNKNVISNFNNLATILKNTIDSSYATQQNYHSRMIDLAKANSFNEELREAKKQNKRLDEQYEDISKIFDTEYIDAATKSAALELANELVRYTDVKIELNSRNVHGNLSSDVLNNSMITNIMNTLKSETALENFGKYKSQSRQYDFSNIMIEHWDYEKDEKGNILRDENNKPIKKGKQPINFGLFEQDIDTKELTPTSYAQRLIKARLFSGATDIISSSKVLYSEISKGDYVATAFVNFFNTEESYEKTKDKVSITFANYFMRIPSDAPKTFIMTAPRYTIGESISGANDSLFYIENKLKANTEINKAINNIPIIREENSVLKENSISRNLNQLISNVTSKNIGDIIIPTLKVVNEKKFHIGDTITINFTHTSKDDIVTEYQLKGVYTRDNGRDILSSPSFVGFVGNTKSSEVMRALEKHYEKELIKKGIIKRVINTNHPIYQQFRQVIVQELNDAATALDVLFSNRNGLIEVISDKNDSRYGQPVFKEGWSNDEYSLRKLFAVYHHKGTSFVIGEDENGKDIVVKQKGIIQDVYEEVLDENGNPKKTSSGSIIYRKKNVPKQLTGSVFTSDRFKITHTDENGNVSLRNYGQEIIDEAFDLLYGGANGNYIHTTRTSKGVNVVLTDKQEAKIQEKLTEFINDYITDTENRISDYAEFIPDHLMTSDNIAEFALNHHLMYVNFNDLFEGDTKFYKDTQTFLKRAKEYQGSGVPYGIVDYDMDLFAPREVISSRLNSKVFTRKKEDGTTENIEIKQYNKFRGVTIKNTIRTSKEVAVKGVDGAKEDGVVTKNLIEALVEGGMTKKEAEIKARNMMKGYHNTTVNDAQSYITFEEWVRRVAARGQLEKYMPLIEAVLDETKPLDAKTIGEFIQVQKNFYYDQHYNAKLGVIAPRQIKNAEFVLVPRLIKGTQLEQVYNMMKQNGIDQLNTEETSKAGKANVLTIWDNEGNITQENIDDFNNNAVQATELFNYNYLYTQQETPQHVNAKNKAGIQIMKKILDNITPDSKLYPIKEKFFKLYSANIKESFTDLMDELNVKTDSNGNIELDEHGNIEGLNYQVLFDMFLDEASRLGLDSNMMDYFTLEDNLMFNTSTNGIKPITKMPTFMSNVSTKNESIAQSLFNSRITRQTLPGFHAAQITNVGWKAGKSSIVYKLTDAGKGKGLADTITEEEFNKLSIKNRMFYNKTKGNISASKELKYHPDGKPYIEVLLPKNNFNLKYEKEDGTLKTDEELLKELSDSGLDTMIGYRIPTEGKQSVCIMKVVGFTDDALGSTIVVPDDWVSQTGSDFDIDSVYGINFTSFLDKKGIIHKVDYKEEADKFDWFRYINSNIQKKLNSKIKEQVEEAGKQASQMLNDAFKALQEEESEAYHSLPDNIRQIIKKIHENFAEDANKSKKDNYIDKLSAVKTAIDTEIANGTHSEELTKQLEDYSEICDAIADLLSEQDKAYNVERRDRINRILENRNTEFEAAAKKNGLMTFEEYKKVPAEQRNNRNARNNAILQSMIDILSSSEALEENLSRSNFDDIIDARDNAIDPNVKKRRNQRSPYNFLDQADYQEDVMSGAKLKAFSVTRDTFCSICNTVRPTISSTQQVKVIYMARDGYKYEDLVKAFNKVDKIGEGDNVGYIVTHDTFGWSNNNKNVVGKILTAYSSQTTAHILDAVKEGAIPNVNDLTFQVYKCFPDLGSDYNTGVRFIMQPGISRIVSAYNANKSIYSRGFKNPIHTAVRSIAKELLKKDGIDIKENESIDVVINKLQKYNTELANIFGATGSNFKIKLEDEEAAKLLISGSNLKDRLNNTGIFEGSSPVEERRKLLFDLGTILQYNKLSHLGSAIGSYARVCNPDKFGAKQTIFETNKVFDDINNIIKEDNPALVVTNKVNNEYKHFLSAIYPDVEKGLDEYIKSTNMDSSYPPLNSFLKYATATSIKINRILFETQDPSFVKEIMKLSNLFSGTTNKMDNKLYKDFQNYILNYLYGQTDAVSKQITYIKGEGFRYRAGSNLEAERSRIFGYGKTPDLRVPDGNGNMVEFTVEDINNPTQREINQFATFSPAQKITWIQGHFRESGVFKYIRTTLFNDKQYRKNKAGSQTIEYVEGNANIETVYNEFNKCFYNDNPLVALAALDIVKYAFVVEGFKMKRNAVNKVISNNCLIGDASVDGTGIVKQLTTLIGQIADGTIDTEMLRHNFIRSHSNIKQIETHWIDKADKAQFGKYITDHGIIHFDITNYNDRTIAEKYGLVYPVGNKGDFGINKYVKLHLGKKLTLYKIVAIKDKVVAYPLNTLEENECSEWSVNIQNNDNLDEAYYKEILEDMLNLSDDTSLKQIIENHKNNVESHRFINKNKRIKSTYASTFDINEKNTIYTGGFEDVINKTKEYFKNNINGKLYLRSRALAEFIKHTGADNGSIQIIDGKKYIIQKVDFRRYNDIYIVDKNLSHTIKEKDPQIVEIIEKAREGGYRVNDAFSITPYIEKTPDLSEVDSEIISPDEIMHSSVTELGSNSMRAMARRQSSEGDIEAGKALKRLHDKDITSKDASVKMHLDEVITTTAEYVQVTTNKILNDLNYFIEDDEKKFHSVNDEITINLIRNNPKERNRFLKTLLDARAFVRNYRMINELDIDSEDETIRPYLKRIKEAINKLQNATIINNAEERFANDYLAKLSNNPLIQGDYISLLDGYHSTGAFDAWVNDLQETSNPLLQIITKEVMGDIRAKEMLATKRIREFKDSLKAIKDAAKTAGISIDWKHIIDDYGKFVQDYNQAFLDKIDELRNNISVKKIKAIKEDATIQDYLEYLKAKFAYDKFKLNHVHQRLKDDYYQRKLQLEEHMIKKFSIIYSTYQKLSDKRRELLSHTRNGALDETYQEELRKVKKEIDNLTSPYFYNDATGLFEEKYSINDDTSPFKGELKTLYSIESANAIQNYISSMKELRDEYFTQDAKFGFDEELEKNRDIISNAELRDTNGRPTIPITELMKNEKYVKAKEWVEQNARYVIDESTKKLINDAFKVLREDKKGRKILSSIAKLHEAYDSHGVIDATKFTEDDIDAIRNDELITYNIREGQPYSDRSLISNAPKNSDVFKTSFYTGMKSNGIENQEYIKIVNDINEILVSYYETATGVLHTNEITEEDLKTLSELYDKIENINKTVGATNSKVVRKYIKDNVDFIINKEAYNEQKEFAKQKGARYLRLWQEVFERIEEDNDGNTIVVANRRVFGYAVPKGYKPDGTGDNSMVDKAKTKALQIIHNYIVTTNTEYYYEKYKEMRAKSDAEFNAWYKKNHVYNPYTHTYQPIQCWTHIEVNPMADEGDHKIIGTWIPAFNQLESRPKDGKDRYGKEDGSADMTNHNYKDKASTAANYKKEGRILEDYSVIPLDENYKIKDTLKDDTDYSNHDVNINEYERKIRELFQYTLNKFATIDSAKQYLNKGYMANRYKRKEVDAKFISKEVIKFLGWIEGASGREAWYEDIDYSNDKTIDMPMMAMLKSKDSIQVNYIRPKRTDDDTDETYNEKLRKYEEDKKKAEEQNLKIHKELLDNDWESVMEDFINKAAHFNAIQDNKYMLFYAKNMIDKLDVYVKNEGFNDLQRDGINSTEDENRYVTKKDTRLQEQYINWIRRLVYDQWKKPNNKLTRTANLLQSMTSAKFMMLNVTGGIANVTLGETQILGEVFAKEYFGTKEWAKGTNIWRSGVPSFFADMYTDKSSSIQSAIVKFMNIVDFDENTGSVHIPDRSTYIERARDLMFSPQAMGEHFMQNSAMFSMMQSHRLFRNNDKESNGKLSYILMNEAEYMRDANEKALKSILTDELKRKWEAFVKYETKDANRTKEYAWFRQDLTTKFATLYLDDEQKQQFIAKYNDNQKKAKEEFNNDEVHPTLYSQLTLGSDGHLDFKEGSILFNIKDEAYQILGRFKGRVISVNKKIHGVYDRLGAAKWESYWWGGIVMQYHKHLYPGIMKRYRRQGYFNEERGTIEKGCYASIKDFLSLPLNKKEFVDKLKADNNMTDSELLSVKGVQNIIRDYVEFATHIKINWNLLPEYERANIKRALGDIAGVMSALCMAIALRVLAGDDDEEGFVYNLFMYEADRLASESFMYNPFGFASEAKKLWSSPVAVQSGIEDLLHTAGFISQWMIQGDEFDPYYQTGLYAGENKLWVNLRRQIPMYHAINMIERLERSNKYYKLGDNMLSIVPVKDIADWIRE